MKYVIVLFVLMYTVTFADGDTTGIEVVNYSVEDCDWDHCKKIEMIRFIEKNMVYIAVRVSFSIMSLL